MKKIESYVEVLKSFNIFSSYCSVMHFSCTEVYQKQGLNIELKKGI